MARAVALVWGHLFVSQMHVTSAHVTAVRLAQRRVKRKFVAHPDLFDLLAVGHARRSVTGSRHILTSAFRMFHFRFGFQRRYTHVAAVSFTLW